MTVFADSSALAKLYIDEPGHELVRSIPDRLVVSALVRVEVASVFWRRTREGSIDAIEASALHALLDADCTTRFAIVATSSRILRRAAELVVRHPLRSLDAIQLSSALAARDAQPEPVSFATFDTALARAAAAERFSLVPLPSV